MAVVGQRYYTPNPFEVTVNGVPLANGRLYFYLTGTSTPLATYNDVALTTPNDNPIVADSNGRFGSIFLSPTQAYKVQLRTAATIENPTGVEIWTEDPCGPAAGGVVSNTAGIVGEVRDFAGIAAAVPTTWYLCYGQAVSRTTYAALFAVLGTTWGAGNGTTTFNLPDFRGRAAFGKDDMGGTPANRVTAGVSGVAGATLGGVGGDQHAQTDTLTAESTAISTATPHTHTFLIHDSTGASLAGYQGNTSNNSTHTTDATTVLVETDVTTTVESELLGTSQNMPPVGIVNKIIYAGV